MQILSLPARLPARFPAIVYLVKCCCELHEIVSVWFVTCLSIDSTNFQRDRHQLKTSSLFEFFQIWESVSESQQIRLGQINRYFQVCDSWNNTLVNIFIKFRNVCFGRNDICIEKYTLWSIYKWICILTICLPKFNLVFRCKLRWLELQYKQKISILCISKKLNNTEYNKAACITNYSCAKIRWKCSRKVANNQMSSLYAVYKYAIWLFVEVFHLLYSLKGLLSYNVETFAQEISTNMHNLFFCLIYMAFTSLQNSIIHFYLKINW